MRTSKSVLLGGLGLAVVGGLCLWLTRSPDETPPSEPLPATTIMEAAPENAADVAAGNGPDRASGTAAGAPVSFDTDRFAVFSPREGEREVNSGDPRLKTFTNAAGETVRTVRTDAGGNPILETRHEDGQVFTVERTFGENGLLLRERRLLNGRPLKDDEFR